MTNTTPESTNDAHHPNNNTEGNNPEDPQNGRGYKFIVILTYIFFLLLIFLPLVAIGWELIEPLFTDTKVYYEDYNNGNFFFKLSILVALYIPSSAVYYCLFRRKIRKKQIRLNFKHLIHDNDNVDECLKSYGYDACRTDIVRLALPALFATIVALFSSIFFFYGEDMDVVTKPNVFFGGMNFLITDLNKGDENKKDNSDNLQRNTEEKKISNYHRLLKFFVDVAEANGPVISNKEDNTEINIEINAQPQAVDSASNQKSNASPPNDQKPDDKDPPEPVPQQTELSPEEKVKKYQKGAFLMYGMASLGAILWGMQHIRRRYALFDINSNVYYSLSIRILLSGVVAVIFYHLTDAFTDGVLAILADSSHNKNAKPSSLLPVVAFFIGMFPQRGILKLKEKVKIFSDENPETIQLPLDAVPGITQDDIVRLKEVGIDNCYSLAHRQFYTLIFQTPYDPLKLLDWVLKSKLYSYFPDSINELRKIGINDATDLYIDEEGSEKEKKLNDSLVEETKLTKLQLSFAFKSIREDHQIRNLIDHRDMLNKHSCSNYEWAQSVNNIV